MDSGSYIFISNEQTSHIIDKDKIARVCSTVLDSLGLAGRELNLRFVPIETMQELNKSFRSKDQSTDVLSFPQLELMDPLTIDSPLGNSNGNPMPVPVGDLVISLTDAQQNAIAIGQPLSREVTFLIVHGILHLVGHDHLSAHEEGIMLEQQQKFMHMLDATLAQAPLWSECVWELN